MYSIPVSDPRVSELITWYLGTLQRAIDIIWENVEWRYRFPRIKRKKQVLIVLVSSKPQSYRRASLSRRSSATISY
jgi:putative transposase